MLCVDKGCTLEDLSGAMNDRDGWRVRMSLGNPCCQSDLMMMTMMMRNSMPSNISYISLEYLTNNYAQVIITSCDTRSIIKRNSTGLNSNFLFFDRLSYQG